MDLPVLKQRNSLILFLGSEMFIFFLFYGFLAYARNSVISAIFYDTYIYLSPLLLVIMILFIPSLRSKLPRVLGSKDMFILFFVVVAWIYVWGLRRINPLYLFYPIAFIDEINFRYVATEFISVYTGRSKAIIIQAFLFMLLYSSYLVFESGGYPGYYALLYLVDMFSMGILYGAIYFVRNNIYIDIALHLSLFAMIPILPAYLGWIPYSMLPT
ncbi:MAG: CPBP family glutamic-type intramembrane protease [Thermoplasmataceae archaeon]|jgi:hypothetical protein